MKRGLILLLAVCTLAAAMVPRDRRAVNSEEDEEKLRKETPTAACAPQTACKWVLFSSGHPEMTILNSYCACSDDTYCKLTERNKSTNADEYHCKPMEEVGEDSATEDS